MNVNRTTRTETLSTDHEIAADQALAVLRLIVSDYRRRYCQELAS